MASKTSNKGFRSRKDVVTTPNPKRGEQTGQTAKTPMASNPLTSKEVKRSPRPNKVGAHAVASKGDKRKPARRAQRPKADHKMTQTQLDEFALKIAALPMAVKDKETFAEMYMDHQNVGDRERFMSNVHAVDVPTPKT